jgi:hypothetical protein
MRLRRDTLGLADDDRDDMIFSPLLRNENTIALVWEKRMGLRPRR